MFNLAGASVPIVVSLVTVPMYLKAVGEAKYGVLVLLWGLSGYFGVFEVGLGRAVANCVARLRREPSERRAAVWTAISISAGFGMIGASILLIAGRLVIDGILRLPAEMRGETRSALPWLAGAVPLVTLSSVFTGVLEGRERFLMRNVISATGAVAFQVAPLGVALSGHKRLAPLVAASVLALLGTTTLLRLLALRVLGSEYRPTFGRTWVKPLFQFGGWITVSGLVAPFLTVVDRIVVGALLGATAVARYAVPFNLVSRLLTVSSSLGLALFPRLSMLEGSEAAVVQRSALRSLILVMTPLTALGLVFVQPFLNLWVGQSFASQAGPVARILLLGTWINSLATVPYTFLQAQSRAEITAKFHLLEVVPYCLALWFGLKLFGLAGAAWAWSFRAALDAALLFCATKIRLQQQRVLSAATLVGGAFAATAVATAAHVAVAVGVAVGAVTGIWLWRLVMVQREEVIR